MTEFLKLLTPRDALEIFLKHLPIQTSTGISHEVISLEKALGRVTAEPVFAPRPLPSFPRSTVDGYAVQAADTHGASDSLPAYLKVAGEVLMGASPAFALHNGEAALIHTGGMLPEGSDAVVMVEHTQPVGKDMVEVLRAVAVGENVIKVGEDVSPGELVIPAGHRLRPAELGGLAALGMTSLPVRPKPRVGILSSGDEVIPPGTPLLPGQVYDINSYTLSSLVERTGGTAIGYGILPDRTDALGNTARLALSECDLVIFTAGSSASVRDLTAEVIHGLGEPGVLVHGVNIRPGKPTILAVCEGKAVIGLPGNPVSALVIAGLFVVPVIERLLGLPAEKPIPSIRSRLATNIPSQAGREDWIPVRLLQNAEGYLAEPIFSKSNLIFSLVRADGMVCIPSDATGLEAGTWVDVRLLV